MLNIPEQVKSLFNRDDIRKNIRITFPQSGRPDITNDNIAAETLSFTESVCSQSTFKYGLAEASVIEFETVGIANMLGETIEAWVEIDATTLPEELQTERDGLTFPVYPVPLGRFVVTACPRNHEAMAHRKVRAMSQIGIDNVITPNDRVIIEKTFAPITGTTNATYDFQKSFDQIAIDLGETPSEEFITQVTYTPSDVDDIAIESNHRIPGLFYSQGETVQIYSRGKYNLMPEPVTGWERYRFEMQDLQQIDYNVFLSQMADQIIEKHIDLRVYGEDGELHHATRDEVIEKVADYLPKNSILCALDFNRSRKDFLPEQTNWVNMPKKRGANTIPLIKADVRWSFSAYGRDESAPRVNTYEVTGAEPRVNVQTYNRPLEYCDPLQSLRLKLQATRTGDGDNMSFNGTEAMQTAVLAYIELKGAFGCFNRYGVKNLKALDTEPVLQLTRAHYETAWWDEYDLAPVGAIAYKIGSNDMLYKFGEGASVYNLHCDELFEVLGITSDQKINEILDVALVPELQKLMYTPVEIDAHGLPYLEAGDCIELEALDGTIIKTYALDRNLRGIQFLQDNITADGITIAEVDV